MSADKAENGDDAYRFMLQRQRGSFRLVLSLLVRTEKVKRLLQASQKVFHL